MGRLFPCAVQNNQYYTTRGELHHGAGTLVGVNPAQGGDQRQEGQSVLLVAPPEEQTHCWILPWLQGCAQASQLTRAAPASPDFSGILSPEVGAALQQSSQRASSSCLGL